MSERIKTLTDTNYTSMIFCSSSSSPIENNSSNRYSVSSLFIIGFFKVCDKIFIVL